LGRAKRIVTGYDGVVDVAMERVDQFLGQQSAAVEAAPSGTSSPSSMRVSI
jgi:hypothetical protein